MLAHFTKRRLPGPGTGDLAYEPNFTLPKFLIGGPGTHYRRGMHPIGPAQLYYGQAQVIDGLNGVAYAGMTSDGVIDFDAYVQNLIRAGEDA